MQEVGEACDGELPECFYVTAATAKYGVNLGVTIEERTVTVRGPARRVRVHVVNRNATPQRFEGDIGYTEGPYMHGVAQQAASHTLAPYRAASAKVQGDYSAAMTRAARQLISQRAAVAAARAGIYIVRGDVIADSRCAPLAKDGCAGKCNEEECDLCCHAIYTRIEMSYIPTDEGERAHLLHMHKQFKEDVENARANEAGPLSVQRARRLRAGSGVARYIDDVAMRLCSLCTQTHFFRPQLGLRGTYGAASCVHPPSGIQTRVGSAGT